MDTKPPDKLMGKAPVLGIGVRAPKDRQEENVFNLAVKTAEKLGCPGVVQRGDVVAVVETDKGVRLCRPQDIVLEIL